MNNLKEFVYTCVENYSKFDDYINQYTLNTYDIPDFIHHEFTSLILSLDNSLAHEATGIDNDLYEKRMLPALLKLLGNTTDKDNQIEFISAWQTGVTNYTNSIFQEMLDNALQDYNFDKGLLHSYKLCRGA